MWRYDPDTLRPVVVDRRACEAAADEAVGLDRCFWALLLGDRPGAAAALGERPTAEPFRWLMWAAEVALAHGDVGAAAGFHDDAWQHATTDRRRGFWHQHVGKRWFDSGAVVVAGREFALAAEWRGDDDPDLAASTDFALAGARRRAGFDAIVVAGGRGRRLGGRELGDKAAYLWQGRPLVDHVVLAVAAATRTVAVGPPRPTPLPVEWCQETPPGGGPLAAVAAGSRLVDSPLVAVVAGDVPLIAGGLDALRAALADAPAAAAAVLADDDGHRGYLTALWRAGALRAAVAALDDPSNRPMRDLYDATPLIDVVEVPDHHHWSTDIDIDIDIDIDASDYPR